MAKKKAREKARQKARQFVQGLIQSYYVDWDEWDKKPRPSEVWVECVMVRSLWEHVEVPPTPAEYKILLVGLPDVRVRGVYDQQLFPNHPVLEYKSNRGKWTKLSLDHTEWLALMDFVYFSAWDSNRCPGAELEDWG